LNALVVECSMPSSCLVVNDWFAPSKIDWDRSHLLGGRNGNTFEPLTLNEIPYPCH
jgi:hypothetical protein